MSPSSAALAVPVGRGDHVRGPQNAPITLVEYGDYECLYCGGAYPLIREILDEMGPDLRFVFRNFPLSQVHEDALPAAQAAEAAALQGKFWEMHDILYENQAALAPDDLLGYAGSLGLDMDDYQSALGDKSLLKRIKDDFRGGVRSGANGTPSFYINGAKYDGPWEDGELREILLAASRAPSHNLPRGRG